MECRLYPRGCIDCGECDICDLNEDKTCDNCMKCLDNDADYSGVLVSEIILKKE